MMIVAIFIFSTSSCMWAENGSTWRSFNWSSYIHNGSCPVLFIWRFQYRLSLGKQNLLKAICKMKGKNMHNKIIFKAAAQVWKYETNSKEALLQAPLISPAINSLLHPPFCQKSFEIKNSSPVEKCSGRAITETFVPLLHLRGRHEKKGPIWLL